MKKIIIAIITGIFTLLFLSIALGEETGIIRGKVIDTYWEPVSKTTVVIDGTEVAESDENGNFLIENLSEGNHTLEFEKEGWQFTAQQILIKDGRISTPGYFEINYNVLRALDGRIPEDKHEQLNTLRNKKLNGQELEESLKKLNFSEEDLKTVMKEAEYFEIQGSLTDWARFLITYIFAVILMLIIASGFLVFVDYYVMPRPTRVITAVGIMVGLFAIVMSVLKTGIYESVLFSLITALLIGILMKKGEGHSRKSIETKIEKEEQLKLKVEEEKDKFRKLIGLEGMAASNLSLYGKVEIDRELYDAKSRKDFIKRGQKICVLDIQGGTLVVEKGAYNRYV